MTFHLRRSESPADGLRRIATEQIGFVLRDFEDPSLDNDARIHSLRARCKKMRALLRLPGPLMGDSFAREDARFRAAGQSLGKLRDDYVQRRTLRELLDRHFGDDASAASWQAATDSARATFASLTRWLEQPLN